MLHNGYKQILMNIIMVGLTGAFWMTIRIFPHLGNSLLYSIYIYTTIVKQLRHLPFTKYISTPASIIPERFAPS